MKKLLLPTLTDPNDPDYDAKIAKGKALGDSLPFNQTFWSEADPVDVLVEALNAEVVAHENKKRAHVGKNLLHLKAILCNLLYAYSRNPDLYVAFSRRNGYYNPNGRYNAVGVSKRLHEVVEALEGLGYVETSMGYRSQFAGKSRMSRMRVTDKLLALFDSYGLTQGMVTIHPDSELIVLRPPKDEAGSVVDYTDTDYTNQARENLRTINALLEDTDIALPLTADEHEQLKARLKAKGEGPIDLTQKTLRRIYNNSDFEQGGRFYGGWWETLPSEYRKRITINGMPSVEVDYSAIHPRVLYAKRGLSCPDDPYVIEGLPQGLRKVVKLALLIIINAVGREAALAALRDKVKDAGLDLMGYSLDDVMGLIEQTHEPIKDDFYTGKGTFLQRVDSDIAEQVMLSFAEQGVVVLPVHDSFIVGAWAETALVEVMEQAFLTLTGQQGAAEAKWDNPVGAILRPVLLRHLMVPE